MTFIYEDSRSAEDVALGRLVVVDWLATSFSMSGIVI